MKDKFVKKLQDKDFKKKLYDTIYDVWFSEAFYQGLKHIPDNEKKELVDKIKSGIVDDIVEEIINEFQKEG